MHGPSSKRFISVEDFRALPRESAPALIDDEHPALCFDTIECMVHVTPFDDMPMAPKVKCGESTARERARRARHRARARAHRSLFEVEQST